MRRFIKICLASLMLSALLPGMGARASGYIYTQDKRDVPTPDAYVFSHVIEVADASGTAAGSPADMAVAPDGTVYVADTGNNRVLILGEGKPTALSAFLLPDGSETALSGPEGICLLDDGSFLVADTGNGRLLHSDARGNVLRVLGRPGNMPGIGREEDYLPVKSDADSMGRIYIVARNINQGLICIGENGAFMGFVGAPRVKPDLLELLWRRFSTKEQLPQMTQYVSTEYNNVLVDSQNFIWGTVSALKASDAGSIPPVAKINSADTDVLKRGGFHPPVGDLRVTADPSRIIDVALGPGGVYGLLDYQRGHIFVYDDNGNMLFVFGELGTRIGGMKKPAALHWQDGAIMVLDSELAEILVYEPTEYGQLVLDAAGAGYEGDFDDAYRLWGEAARSNVNFEYAFVGMGSVYMNEKEYGRAMEYFRYAGQSRLYSEAFEAARRQTLERLFPWLFGGAALLLAALLIGRFAKRIFRYIRGGDGV